MPDVTFSELDSLLFTITCWTRFPRKLVTKLTTSVEIPYVCLDMRRRCGIGFKKKIHIYAVHTKTCFETPRGGGEVGVGGE